MSVQFPPIEPYDHGMLDVGDGNLVYWEACGNPAGKPALVVHGGPGSGCSPGPRRSFDPSRYRIVLFDQRGCGRSTPHASDPATDMATNTTEHLIADMEALRQHLGIDRWQLTGGSWGCTLVLAYAQRHPQRVTEIVLAAVSTTRPAEIDWLYRGARRFFPEAWQRFAAGVPAVDRDGDLVAAYAELMEHPDARVREGAAANWMAWEDAVVSLDPGGKPGIFSDRPSAAALAFVRICTRYYAHHGWLEDGILIREAGKLAGIPGVILHGRRDLSCPLETAWELASAWPGAELVVFDDAGHQSTSAMGAAKRAAIAAFVDR